MNLEKINEEITLELLKDRVESSLASIEEATAYGHLVERFHLHELAKVVGLAYSLIESGEGGPYSSLADWGFKEFEWHKSTTYQYLQAYKVIVLLGVYNCRLPEKIGQIRELFRFLSSPEDCYKVWSSALSSSEATNRNLTASKIRELGDEVILNRHSKGVSRNTKFEEPDLLEEEWNVETWPSEDSLPKEEPKYTFTILEDYKKLSKVAKGEALRSDVYSDSRFISQKTSSIEWADWSWNPVTGCLHTCSYCYARDIANRFYPQGFVPTFHPDRLKAPFNMTPPQEADTFLQAKNVFTCSMADLFGKWVPSEWIVEVLDTISQAPGWNFLFLTKFPLRLSEFDIPDNAWIGASVDRIARVKPTEKAFREVQAKIKWVSVEPMLEPILFNEIELFDWIVIGGASASTKTPSWVPPTPWVSELITQAKTNGLMVYQKTNLINGRNQDEWIARLKEWPSNEYVENQERKLPPSLKYWK